MKNSKDPRSNKLYGVLYDNRPPTYAEVASLKDGIKSITKKITALRGELADLEDQLHRHQSALAPIRRLPFEVLGEIFRLAVRYSMKESPWNDSVVDLTLVCKTWRNAALAAGHLWSWEEISGPEITAKTSKAVARWFARARGSPTTLKVRRSDGACPCAKPAPGKCKCLNTQFLDLLSKGPPIHRLILSGFAPKCVAALFEGLGKRASPTKGTNLQALTLVMYGKHAPYAVWVPMAGSSQLALPPVEDLKLVIEHLQAGDTTQLPMPIAASTLNRLTTFSLKCGWGGPQVAMALQHCSNVEHLTLDFDDGHPSWDPSKGLIPAVSKAGYIELPKVHTLILDVNIPGSAEELLNHLRFPALSTLWLGWSRVDYRCTKPMWTILNALNVFGPVDPTPIRSLHLNLHYQWPLSTAISAEDLTKVLSDIPNLVNLSMSAREFDSVAFLDCQPKGKEAANAPLLAPTLERWELVDTREPFHLDSFLKYIKSRQKYRKQKGKIVFQEPMNKLKDIVLTGDWDDRRSRKIERAYTNVSATLKEVRKVFGVRVERFGFKYGQDDPVDAAEDVVEDDEEDEDD